MVLANENPARERILERIRTGLRVVVPDPPAGPIGTGVIFTPVENPLERFQQEAKANLMECLPAGDNASGTEHLKQVLESLSDGEIYVQDDPALRRMIESVQTQRPIRWSSQGAPREESQATVTLVDALIAQTGSIFVTAACGGRGASVVAPCHIAVARASQLVPDLQTALRSATQQGKLEQNSFACVISGSSRTADIEKILVQGAHGPRRLVVVLLTGA
jgi:L-lactate dehydrogenase complex protein LldG